MKTMNQKSSSRMVRWFAAAMVMVGVGMSGSVMAASIKDTKHNLSTSGTGTNHVTAGTGSNQICVFCHTPHGADNSQAVPLWNKKMDSTGFTTYASLGTASLDGEVMGVGSISLACLSCHDGAQAMDNMINAPGSGGYDAGGARPTGWTWTAGAEALGGKMPAGVTNLGKDLSNDHPIGIQYCGGGPNVASPAAACKDGDFVAPTNGTVNTNNLFWVEVTGTGAGRQKGDIPLYVRTFPTGGAGPSVECGSCHDPHVADNAATDGLAFMRVTTDQSKICLACHVK